MEDVLGEGINYVGRLAPSPTGALHLGNVRTFMIAYLRARVAGGRVILRMEDLDHPKDKKGAAKAAIEDLTWLGFDWDEEYVQSARKEIYKDVLSDLVRAGRVYPCVCSRRDVEAAQSAPHDGEQLFYSGICRGRFARWREAADAIAPRTPCWRFKVDPPAIVSFKDAFCGSVVENVATTLGDFPLARDEGGAGYTLAATIDDLLMGVTEVVRGDDLLAATPAQILLAEALMPSLRARYSLDRAPLRYCHVPLVVGADGRRLAKRHGDTRVSAYRAMGVRPEEIIGRLAATCGWAKEGECLNLADLLPRFTLSTIPRTPYMISLDVV